MNVDLVIPTAGRPSLGRLLAALGAGGGPALGRVVVVDDRPAGAARALEGLDAIGPAAADFRVVRGRAEGPAAARNLGWRTCTASWVAFLDDDVVPEPGWRGRLARDLEALAADVAGSQGRIVVPLPEGRRPTDWERNVAGLEGARWATADMAYRRGALSEVGGFDERFRRAYREDADLALRMLARGWRLVPGRRTVSHPVGPSRALVSLRLQGGNADDVLMRALHGRGWRARAGAPAGRRPRHLAVTAAGLAGLAAAAAGRRGVAGACAAAWLAGTAELAWARIAPGPRTPREVALMAATSAAIPPLAAWHTARGVLRRRRLVADRTRRPAPAPAAPRPRAVLIDRDGTLVADVPYNGDPARVRPLPGVPEALERLRREGVPTAVVSNQSGLARGLLTRADVEAVNRRIEALLGPLGPWMICPHGPDDGCRCRKPRPGLVEGAAAALGVPAWQCAVIGDIGADVDAARRAGARAVLVPTSRTLPREIAAAPEVAADMAAAVEILLGAGR
jgi:histidinol-phosphate phosphatase family protein